MKPLAYKLVSVIVAGAFALAAIFCCLNHPVPGSKGVAKHSCCASKASKDRAPKGDCSACPIVQKSVDVGHVFVFSPDIAPQVFFAPKVHISFKPVHTMAPVFLNGPPGPVAATPLYLRFRSIRI